MRIPRLLNLGCALLALGVGMPAAAQEAPAEQAAAGSAVEMPEADASAADEMLEAAAAEAQAPDAGKSMGEEQAAAEADAVLEAMPVGAAAPAEQSDAQAAAMPAPAMNLGAVGYDAQGREGRVHVVSSGDTLWDISDGYLGTPWVWPSIWEDNRNIENPHLIYPGDRIWITPWEMRKVTAEEAEALLSGRPAAPETLAEAVSPPAAPLPAAPAPAPEVVPQELVTVLVPDRERAGLVSREMLDASASVLANVSPRLMISQQDHVYIGLAEGETKVGDQFTVYRVADKVYDPESGRMLGYHVDFLGWVEVLETHDESSMAEVKRSIAEIEIGDKLMPREQPQNQIAVRSGGPGVEGQVSFLAESRTHMGTHDFVYLNRGTLDGVEVGTPLTVYRRGFRTRDEALDTRVQVPDRPVANLLVVRAQDEASVALIRKTEEEIELGDYFRSAAN